jgi:hypothetical protein
MRDVQTFVFRGPLGCSLLESTDEINSNSDEHMLPARGIDQNVAAWRTGGISINPRTARQVSEWYTLYPQVFFDEAGHPVEQPAPAAYAPHYQPFNIGPEPVPWPEPTRYHTGELEWRYTTDRTPWNGEVREFRPVTVEEYVRVMRDLTRERAPRTTAVEEYERQARRRARIQAYYDSPRPYDAAALERSTYRGIPVPTLAEIRRRYLNEIYANGNPSIFRREPGGLDMADGPGHSVATIVSESGATGEPIPPSV